jgi:dTMP kinase
MRFEDMGLQVQSRARDGFLALAAAQPRRIKVIDGNRPADQVAADVLALALGHLPALL